MSDDDLDGSDFVLGGPVGTEPSVRWRSLFFTLFSATVLAVASLVVSAWDGLFRGIEWVVTAMFDTLIVVPLELIRSNTRLVSESFDISAVALQQEFGVMAFVAGIVVIGVFMVIIEATISFVMGWLAQ